MASQQIRVEYDLALPNSFLVDHATTDGKTRTAVYDGPDKIYLQIGADGREVAGPLTEDDILDGRPMPADCVDWFEVDCATNPLVCQLRGPVVDELEEEYTGETVHPGSPDIDGYPQFSYGTPIMPNDLYNKESVRVVKGEITMDRYTVAQKLLDRDDELTWEEIRQKRNDALSNSDSKSADDMPAALLQEWKTYRQKLRDFPATMEAAGVTPSVAFYMFPVEPEFTNPE
mgnify:FL=1|tara:strand:- start:1220 stop:1909 length:690 start_codon:yes stop_codon:yes gene_type:complete